MEQIVDKITQNFLQKLPDQSQSFSPEELLSSGIPYIVVETLRKNIISTVDSELNMPESKWLYVSEEVQMAWQNFVEISKQHLLIPKDNLLYLLTEAVEQCLELAVKPRQAVPEVIFRTRDTIDLKTAKERVVSMQVNKQLGLALLRYMEKKEKKEIELEQARQLIKKVDEKLVEDYHPLKWAQTLKPVFDLAGPAVEADLFQIYFEEKEKPAYARKFDQLEGPLNESEFIEALSSADVVDVDVYKDEQPELFVPVEEEIEEMPEEEKIVSNEEESFFDEPTPEEDEDDLPAEDFQEVYDAEETPFEENEMEDFEEPAYEYPESSDEEDFDEDDEEEERKENIVNLFSKIREVDHFEKDDEDPKPVISLVKDEEEEDEEEDNITLLSKFIFDESNDEPSEGDGEEPDSLDSSRQKEPSSIYDEMNLVQEDGRNQQTNEDIFDDSDESEEEFSFKIESPEEEPDPSEETYPVKEEQINYDEDVDEDEDENDDQPMWRSFLERDDMETDSGYEYEEESKEEVEEFEEDEEDGFIEEPIYDLTTEEPDPEEKISKISGWMDDEKDRFVNEIFMGSEFAYEQALLDIMDFENWKAASMYLESDVFSRNRIDVYDEVAVDFTDRLHSYFLENNSNNDG